MARVPFLTRQNKKKQAPKYAQRNFLGPFRHPTRTPPSPTWPSPHGGCAGLGWAGTTHPITNLEEENSVPATLLFLNSLGDTRPQIGGRVAVGLHVAPHFLRCMHNAVLRRHHQHVVEQCEGRLQPALRLAVHLEDAAEGRCPWPSSGRVRNSSG